MIVAPGSGSNYQVRVIANAPGPFDWALWHGGAALLRDQAHVREYASASHCNWLRHRLARARSGTDLRAV